ncbi:MULTISPECIES: diacylglycerol kinase family protein [unclassified Virgibacillus]|uniref:diacylglycerol kinase family protein n=1 Tax=unclassified Virgibacillus TaxID=2620237 RepID=UPI0024DF0096|nr:diacylglycerol kinase family protein [Virgibacillus sp. LDC-1]
MSDKKRGIGFRYAWSGLKQIIRMEKNFQVHLGVAFLVIIAGFYFQISRFEWIAVIISIGMVLICEMINTAIESFLDYVRPQIHPAAKLIKDIAAGAVLVAAMMAVVIGCIVFLPKIKILLGL